MLQGKWSGCVWPVSKEAVHQPDTGVEREVLIEVAKASVTLPDGFVSGHLAPCRDYQPAHGCDPARVSRPHLRELMSERSLSSETTHLIPAQGARYQSRFRHCRSDGFRKLDEGGG